MTDRTFSARHSDGGVSLGRRAFCAGAVGFVALGGAACGSAGGDESSGASSQAAAAGRQFAHPGLLHTEADFARMRDKIGAGAQPWLAGWNALTSSSRAQLGATPRPLATVVRGGDG